MPRRTLASRLAALAITLVSTVAMLGVSFEAEAQRRMGGGGSFGRQSSNVMQQRQAVTPPAARSAQGQQTTPNASTAARQGQAAAAPRSAASRWLGPIAGIAAGLGIAALLSSLGLGAAAAEFIGSLLLIALVVFAALYLFRRLRGASAGQQPAMQGAHHGQAANNPIMQRQAAPVAPAAPAHPAVANTVAPTDVVQDERWFIPADFDTQQFLQHAKQHFIDLQDAWDKNDLPRMREYMTDELVAALEAPLAAREPGGKTDVVLLNAQLLGIEKIDDGNMASVRFSGMLRDDSGPEAYRFEEVWNFLKPTTGGWVLAGIQQIPVEHES